MTTALKVGMAEQLEMLADAEDQSYLHAKNRDEEIRHWKKRNTLYEAAKIVREYDEA